MAAIPKSFTLSAVMASTDIGTVPANKAWLIKSLIVSSVTASVDKSAADIGGLRTLIGPLFGGVVDENLDLLVDKINKVHMRTVVASAGEIVRYVVLIGVVAKDVRLSVIEVDV